LPNNERGFSLVELVVVTGILSVTITSMLQMYIYTSTQSELSGNLTSAVSEAQTKIEEIRTVTYDSIATNYASGGTPGNIFDTTLITGKGVVTIDSSNAELLEIEVVVCWRDKYNRIIGEDTDLDGVLDPGEDANNNGVIDSPVELVTYFTRR